MKIVVFANAFTGVSGGDKIFVEYGRYWLHMGIDVEIVTNEKGRNFCLQHGIPKRDIRVWNSSFMDRMGVYISSLYKVAGASIGGVFFRSSGCDIFFSASDFWPDVFPVLLAKARASKTKWLAACYLLAPFPDGKGYSEKHVRAYIFYYTQKVSLWLIKTFADAVITHSHIAREFYNGRQLSPGTVFAVQGGVDVKSSNSVPKQKTIYHAIFVGRFHRQKCLDELISIWKMVLQSAPECKLALIGGGSLEKRLREKVVHDDIKHAVSFLGIVDGISKIRLLRSSRVFVSASRFDSGNIALVEALACGVPGVIYDLPELRYYRGVIKIPCGETRAFAKAVLELLNKEEMYKRLSNEAKVFATTMDWRARAGEALKFIKGL